MENKIANVINQAATTFEKVNCPLDFAREARYALDVLNSNPYLMGVAQKDPESLRRAIQNIALTGLSLSPVTKLAYMVPRKGKICLDISYMGMITLMHAYGWVKSIWSECIFEGDDYVVDMGTANTIEHHPQYDKRTDKIIGCYAIAELSTGGRIQAFMATVEIESIMKRSDAVKAGKGSPWDTDRGEMFKKTVIRRLWKMVPKIDVPDRLLHAVDAELEANSIDLSIRPDNSDLYDDLISDAEIVHTMEGAK